MKRHNIDSIVTDIKRLKTTFKNTKSLNAVLEFLEKNKIPTETPIRTDRERELTNNKEIVASNKTKGGDRCVDVMQFIQYGLNEKSIIRNYEDKTFERKHKITADKTKDADRCVNVIQGIGFGLNEKTIIKQARDHYNTIHPTQKPVRLLERLLALVIPKDKPRNEIVVADFFAGSMSCMEAVYNMGMKGIATEIDQEYFQAGKQRIENLSKKTV
jgi:DNA (cytosine-5-)-methyltransferase